MNEDNTKKAFSLTPDLKRKLIFFPIAFLLAFIFLYFTVIKKDDIIKEKATGFDYVLPEGKDNKLPDNKLEVVSEYGKFKRKKEGKENSSFNYSFDDLVQDKEPANTTTDSLKNSDKNIINNIKKQLNINTTPVVVYNKKERVVSPTKKRTSRSEINEKETQNWKKETEKDYNNFFFSNTDNSENRVNINTNTNIVTNQVVRAYVSGDQTIHNNGRIKLRLSETTLINGSSYSKNAHFFAVAKFSKKGITKFLVVLD